MKSQSYRLPLLIGVLIAASLFVIFGYTTDPKTHRHVPRFPVHYGLDIRGGVRAVLEITAPPAAYEGKMQEILATIEKRINIAGVGEAVVQRKGQNQIVVELPEAKNGNAVLEKLGTTAQMEFRHFKDVRTANPMPEQTSHIRGFQYRQYLMSATDTEPRTYSFVDTRSNQSFRDGSAILTDFLSVINQGSNERPGASQYEPPQVFKDRIGEEKIYLTPEQSDKANKLASEMAQWEAFLNQEPVIVKGDQIQPNSSAQLDGATPAVSQTFTDSGAAAMEKFTTDNTYDLEAIILDGKVLSVPYIKDVIRDRGQISGGFTTLRQAQDLADLLNAGALPVPLKQVQTESIDATLGAGAVKTMAIAGCIGLALVLVFMLAMYRLPGLVADVALVIYTLFTLAIFRGGLQWLGLPPVTLTLAGMAGFVLSIGMAVDANILIFERMKEEMRNGRSLRPAIDAGFRRAFPAIRDSNICTIITCIVLLSMGSASVRGFALTLMLGVIVSLFSAITVTRTLLYSLVNAGLGKNQALFGVVTRDVSKPVEEKPGFNIVGKRKWFYLASLVIIIPGIIFWAKGGLKRSIEFSGGSQIEVRFPQSMDQEKIRQTVAAAGISDPLVQMADNRHVALISTPEQTNVVDMFGHNQVEVKLQNALEPLKPFTREGFDNVLPTISKEFVSNAFQAVCLASVLIVIYLAFVFGIGGFVAGLRLGTSAIVALLHDVLVLIGVFAILGYFLNWKIDSLFVTATLTVIGFSVHDTVVIFDRVRENLRHRKKDEDFEGLVNKSILQTFRRSVATSLTVLMTLLSLILFGVHTTLLLNVALFVGILSGTYSSIFNAASILVDWENWLARKRASGPPSGGSSSSGGSSAPKAERRPAAAALREMRAGSSTTTPASNGPSITSVKTKRKRPARRF